MKPLFILIAVFIIGLLLKSLMSKNKISYKQLGRIAMSCMLLFTGTAHFFFTEGMSEMLPNLFPFRNEIVVLSGVFEIVAAIGLLSKKWFRLSGTLLVLFFILVFPANIFAALNGIDPLTGAADGPGAEYLFIRIPIQIFYILWVYFFTLFNHQKFFIMQNSNKNVRKLFSILMLIFLTGLSSESSAQDQTSAVEIANNYVEIYVNVEIDKLAGFYSEYSSFQDPTLEAVSADAALEVKGPIAIIEKLKRNFKGVMKPKYKLNNYYHTGRYHIFQGEYSYEQNGVNFGGPDIDFKFNLQSTTILLIDNGKVLKHIEYMDYKKWFEQFNNQNK